MHFSLFNYFEFLRKIQMIISNFVNWEVCMIADRIDMELRLYVYYLCTGLIWDHDRGGSICSRGGWAYFQNCSKTLSNFFQFDQIDFRQNFEKKTGQKGRFFVVIFWKILTNKCVIFWRALPLQN